MLVNNDSELELLPQKNRSIDSDTNNDNELKPLIDEHSKLLILSKKLGKYWILIGALYFLFYHCRWYVWILYAQSLGESDNNILAISVWSIFFLQAIASLFWSWISDKYTFETVGIILSIITFIGLFIESIAYNYYMLLFGAIIAAIARGIESLGIAYLTKYLPNYYAIKYLSGKYTLTGFVTLLGPIFSGTLTYFINVRSVFYLCFAISAFKLLFFISFIRGHESNIYKNQIKMKNTLYKQLKRARNTSNNLLLNEDYQFPVCTKKFESPKLSKSKLFMLINVLLANSCSLGNEAAFSTYFVIFCMDLDNISVLISSAMMCSMLISFIIACILTPILIKKIKYHNLKIEYVSVIVITIYVIILLLMIEYIINRFTAEIVLWIFCINIGFCLGIINMLLEMILLSIQPKKHSGKISGIKSFCRNIIKAVITVLIGLTYSINIFWFFYMQAIFFSIELFCVFIMMTVSFTKVS